MLPPWISSLREEAVVARAQRELAPLRAKLERLIRSKQVNTQIFVNTLDEMNDIYALCLTAGVVAGWISPFFPEVQEMPPGDASERPASITEEVKDMALGSAMWPFLENAVDWLQSTFAAVPTKLADLVDAAQIEAAAYGTPVDLRLVQRMNSELDESIRLGEGREDWAKRSKAIIETRAGFDEAIGRTTHHRAFRAGQKDILRQPVIEDLFPYRKYFCTIDGRERPHHRALNENVYHKESPLAAKADANLHEWNCRCSEVAMTEEDALSEGVTVGGEPRGFSPLAAVADAFAGAA